jgi:hypothetical protein
MTARFREADELQARVSKHEAEAEFDDLTLLSKIMVVFVFGVVGQVVGIWLMSRGWL